MKVKTYWPAERGSGRLPWWAYALFIPGVFCLAWILYLVGVIPGK
ncbi:hypothetical protein [Hymenobacter actinosclerus]|nr:hypothetical protein [Hymenobacter actinosclerus]